MTVDELLAEARASQLAGEPERAKELCQRVLETDPEHAEAHYQLGLVELERGQWAAAREHLGRAIATQPGHARFHASLAMVLRACGEPEQAAQSCALALEIDPCFAPAALELGVLASERGDLAQAEARYRQAAELAPSLREAHCNLGAVLERQGKIEQATSAYRRALEADPGYVRALSNLANLLYRQRAWDEALALYRRVAELSPGSGLARHMAAALGGTTTRGCPSDYVTQLFDACAARFEACLLGELAYATPEELRRLLLEGAPPELRFGHALDLGCGTGLVGRALRGRCQRLVGVDLSPKMIALAERSGHYDEVHLADNVAFLEAAAPGWDLVTAADVLPYSGDLAACFAAVARKAAPGARFAFSTEANDEQDYVLRRTGRFAHHPRYIERLGQSHGLRIERRQRRELRLEAGRPVLGDLYVLRPAV